MTEQEIYIKMLEEEYRNLQSRYDALQKKVAAQPQPRKRVRWPDVLFYAVIAVILITTALYSGKHNDGFRLFGYSGFAVLSGSMEREIPQGSLVITKKTDPRDVRVGSDITFVRSDNATVTHRVVTIYNNYEGMGLIAFETKGLENPEPDAELVYEGNLIGVVIHTVPKAGAALNYISNNIGLVLIILSALLVMSVAVSKLLAPPRREAAPPAPAANMAATR